MPYAFFNEATAVAAPALTIGTPGNIPGQRLSELRAKLLARLANRGDVTPTQLDQWINDAYVELASTLELPDFKVFYEFVTVTDAGIYKLPPELRSFKSLAVADSTHPRGGWSLYMRDMAAYVRSPVLAGDPKWYVKDGNLVGFYPTPSRVLTMAVSGWFVPDQLVNDNDSPLLAREWIRPLVVKAKQLALQDLRDFAGAAATAVEYANMVRERLDRDAQDQDNTIGGFFVARSLADLTEEM